MAHPLHHAQSSVAKYGGSVADYIDLHTWMDASKAQMADFRHRALRHHAQGIFESETIFGKVIINSDGRPVPTRFISEQHVKEDCGGRIPTLCEWFSRIAPAPWMSVGHIETTPPVQDLSRDAWVEAANRGETVLGFQDWRCERAGPLGLAALAC